MRTGGGEKEGATPQPASSSQKMSVSTMTNLIVLMMFLLTVSIMVLTCASDIAIVKDDLVKDICEKIQDVPEVKIPA